MKGNKENLLNINVYIIFGKNLLIWFQDIEHTMQVDASTIK